MPQTKSTTCGFQEHWPSSSPHAHAVVGNIALMVGLLAVQFVVVVVYGGATGTGTVTVRSANSAAVAAVCEREIMGASV